MQILEKVCSVRKVEAGIRIVLLKEKWKMKPEKVGRIKIIHNNMIKD